MVDIHTHILNGVDDGSDTLNSSVAILRLAKESGVTDVILTPHYILRETTGFTNENVKENFEILKAELKKQQIDINIYLGNEIFADMKVISRIKNKEAFTLNDSNYVLIEFPMERVAPDVLDIIYEITRLGITPIIAHPERCVSFIKDKNLIDDCIEEGAVFQINAGSILGRFGKDAKKLAIKMIKSGKASFVSTDTHSLRREEYTRLQELDKELEKLVGKYEKNKLLVYNGRNVLINNKLEG